MHFQFRFNTSIISPLTPVEAVVLSIGIVGLKSWEVERPSVYFSTHAVSEFKVKFLHTF